MNTEEEIRLNDPENETIIFITGYTTDLFTGRVWFCKLDRNGICVEDYGQTKRAALRHVRKAWKKLDRERAKKNRCYPKVCKDYQ